MTLYVGSNHVTVVSPMLFGDISPRKGIGVAVCDYSLSTYAARIENAGNFLFCGCAI